jgi:ATP-dependent DNA helicase RecG
MVEWTTGISALSGVGPKKEQELSALGILDIGSLLYHFPRAYQNRGETCSILQAAQSGEKCALILTVGSEVQNVVLKNRKTLSKFTVFDETGRCSVTFFNSRFVSSLFHIGQVWRFYGKIERYKSSYLLTAPEYEPILSDHPLPALVPIYRLSAGLSQKFLRSIVAQALDQLSPDTPDPVESVYREQFQLVSFREALRAIHQPVNLAELEKARNYFIFEELYRFAKGILGAKQIRVHQTAPILSFSKEQKEAFLSLLPFSLTHAQDRVLSEIAADLSSGRPMNRLVTGDVGSGKTVCAAGAAYIAVQNGYQVALLVPTEILARQHEQDLSALLAPAGIEVGLLVGSLSAAEKKKVQKRLADGSLPFVVGTHALLSAGVHLAKGGLVITDEQHRFGLSQRESLSGKAGLSGQSVHVLSLSATPIPRSLALILYGDLDLSSVDELPPGRQKVSTFTVDESYRERMEGFLEKQVAEGKQAYIVCPSIEEEEELKDQGRLVSLSGKTLEEGTALKSAVSYAKELSERHPKLSVGLLHGKMRPSEKESIMADFVQGKISVLVSTTVIEVGVNVPRATLMIVENAERFGLSQLHQLRGRVGRGKEKSWCILVSDSQREEAQKRLQTLCHTTDGYQIAQTDLAMRGPGDFFPAEQGGSRQSGELRFRIASLCENQDLLLSAFSAAQDWTNRSFLP